MVESENLILKLSKVLFYGYLFLFPLGQLLRIDFNIFSVNIDINFIDLWVLPAIIIFFSKNIKKPNISSYLNTFLVISVFSLIYSLSIFNLEIIIKGSLYLLRLFSYFSFFAVVYFLLERKEIDRENVFKALLIVLLAIAVFGWFQYFLYPNLTQLKYLGWDDHYLRLVSTFLDPTFTGLLMVFGSLMSFNKLNSEKNNANLLLFLIFLISLIFTYSRASYLSLFITILYFVYKKKNTYIKSKNLIILVVGILVSIFVFLPRNIGEGTSLLRTQSIKAKLNNYQETLSIIQKSPLLGVGFNNFCAARDKYFGTNTESHGCGGSDSSLMFIIATTGVLGLLSFVKIVWELYVNSANNFFSESFKLILISTFIHSFFANSLFYSFVLGFIMINGALALEFRDNK